MFWLHVGIDGMFIQPCWDIRHQQFYMFYTNIEKLIEFLDVPNGKINTKVAILHQAENFGLTVPPSANHLSIISL